MDVRSGQLEKINSKFKWNEIGKPDVFLAILRKENGKRRFAD